MSNLLNSKVSVKSSGNKKTKVADRSLLKPSAKKNVDIIRNWKSSIEHLP